MCLYRVASRERGKIFVHFDEKLRPDKWKLENCMKKNLFLHSVRFCFYGNIADKYSERQVNRQKTMQKKQCIVGLQFQSICVCQRWCGNIKQHNRLHVLVKNQPLLEAAASYLPNISHWTEPLSSIVPHCRILMARDNVLQKYWTEIRPAHKSVCTGVHNEIKPQLVNNDHGENSQ